MTTTDYRADALDHETRRHQLADRFDALADDAWQRAGQADADACRPQLAPYLRNRAAVLAERNRAAAYAYDHAAHMTRTNTRST